MVSVKKENRNWIVFANEKLCDHVKAMSEIHCCNWASHHYRFEIGDVVYMYVCNIDGETRRIRYKTIVEAVHLTDRVDKSYWHIPLSGNESCLLRLVEEYDGKIMMQIAYGGSKTTYKVGERRIFAPSDIPEPLSIHIGLLYLYLLPIDTPE